MDLSSYKPQSKLVVPAHPVLNPRFPVVDAHNHLDGFMPHIAKMPVSEILSIMDESATRVYVDLDGGWGEDILNRHLDRYKAAAPDRFMMFGGVDWSQWPDPGRPVWRMGSKTPARASCPRRPGIKNLETVWPARPRPARPTRADQ